MDIESGSIRITQEPPQPFRATFVKPSYQAIVLHAAGCRMRRHKPLLDSEIWRLLFARSKQGQDSACGQQQQQQQRTGRF
jgi:hypothetical protein